MRLTDRARGFFGRVAPVLFLAFWVLLLLALVIALWKACPAWLTGEESGSTTIRNLGLVVAAAIGLPLAIWRSRVAERQAEAAHRQAETAFRSLLNDRFQKAAEMLGHPASAAVRIGGINALARLARERTADFHLPVARLLAAFVSDTAPRRADGQAETTSNSLGAQAGESTAGTHTHEPAPSVETSWRRGSSWEAELLHLRLAADREVGPVRGLPKDVEEVMVLVSNRTDSQAALEIAEGFRMNLAGSSLRGLRLHGADLSRFVFTKADLRRIRAWDGLFTEAVLAGADLSAARLIGAQFANADMRRVNLTAASLTGANFRDADLGLVDLTSENLWQGRTFPSTLLCADLLEADLTRANLGRADLRHARLVSATLDECDLTGANLNGADLRAASLKGSKLAGAALKETNLGGRGADLSGADLTGADLTNANLGLANLTGVLLTGSNLTGTDFSYDPGEWSRPRATGSGQG